MSANSTTSAPVVTAATKVAEALAKFVPAKGLPTWKRTGTDAATVAEFLLNSDPKSVAIDWQNRSGVLAKLPGSLVSQAIMSAMMGKTTEDQREALRAAFTTVESGQSASTGDTLTDNSATAGKSVGEQISILKAALETLETMLPEQVSKAGQERIAAYLTARDVARSIAADPVKVSKAVGSHVNGNTALAGTFGKSAMFVKVEVK